MCSLAHTHLLAYALVDDIAARGNADRLFSYAASGFRDFTRIAASDPKIWRDILMANKTEVLAQSQRFRDMLDLLEQVMQRGDTQALETLIKQASDGRAQWQLGQLGQAQTVAPKAK